MKTTILKVASFAAVLALAVSGCNTEREKNHDRAILKAGQQVSAEMVGWVAVPNTAPVTKKDKVDYAVLSTHNVVPETLEGWVAINPAFFSKLSGIKTEPAGGAAGERWVLKPEGKSVPKDKHGWVAVPYSEPQIEKSEHKKDREMAVLANGNIIPKEMNGWVAISSDSLAKLTDAFMKTGAGSKVSKTE